MRVCHFVPSMLYRLPRLRRCISLIDDALISGGLSTAGPSPLQQLPTEETRDAEIQTSEKGYLTVEKTQTHDRLFRIAKAVYRQRKISVKKLTPVARLVRQMRVEDALLQLDLVHRKASVIVRNAIRSATANGVHNHGLDASKLYVEHCYATNGTNLKRIRIHGKGYHGKMLKRRSHLTVILRESAFPRPRPHRIQETWLQRQQRKERGEVSPGASKPRSTKILSARSKWKKQVRRMRTKAKEQRQGERQRERRRTRQQTEME